MNKICFQFTFFALLILISCSSKDKFDAENSLRISTGGIDYQIDGEYLYLNPNLFLNRDDSSDVEMELFWIIDDDTTHSNRYYIRVEVGYGLHFVKFILIDSFGDTLSDSAYIQMNEPLSVNLLSPVEDFCFSEKDTVKFQYKLNGTDKENAKSSVYICCDEDSTWQELSGSNYELNDSIYWKVRAYTDQEDVFSKEVRRICLKE